MFEKSILSTTLVLVHFWKTTHNRLSLNMAIQIAFLVISMTLVQLLEESKKDTGKINLDDLLHESSRIPESFTKYHQMYRAVRSTLRDLKKKEKPLRLEKWEYYSGTAAPEVYKKKPFALQLRTKEKKDEYINADPEIVTLLSQIETLEEKEDTLKTIMDQLNRRQFNISNINNSMKFFNGDN